MHWMVFALVFFYGNLLISAVAVSFHYNGFIFNFSTVFCQFTFLFQTSSTGSACIARLARVRFLGRLLLDAQLQVALTMGASLLLCWLQWAAAGRLRLLQHTVPLRHWNSSRPLRVALLSDLHAGASVYADQVARVVDFTNDLRPDAVFLVGDTVDAPLQRIAERVAPLRYLHSRLGTFLVTGNHEYYYGSWSEWARHFERAGITVLQNECAHVEFVE